MKRIALKLQHNMTGTDVNECYYYVSVAS